MVILNLQFAIFQFLTSIHLLLQTQAGLQACLKGQAICGMSGVTGVSPLCGQDDPDIKETRKDESPCSATSPKLTKFLSPLQRNGEKP